MILLASTTDLLRLITSAAVATDVYVSWVDLDKALDPDEAVPGRNLVNITTAATTTLVPSPGAGTTYRGVKAITVVNVHATTAQAISLVLTNGTITVELASVTLAAGWSLVYDEGRGLRVLDSQGREVVNQLAGGSPAAVAEINLVVLASPVTNNNATANTIADVTGLSFPVNAGETYRFHAMVWYTAAATTTGSRWSINGPASPTRLSYRSQYSLTATTETVNSGLSAYDLPAAANATSVQAAGSAVANLAIIEGIITPSANGNVVIRFASEVASSAIVALPGSKIEWTRVL